MNRARVALLLFVAGACARPVEPAGRAPSASTAPFAGWDSVATRAVTDGVTHTTALTAAGPWAVQVLTIDLARCTPHLEARKPGPPLAQRATTTALSSDALAAINADFFMLPGGTPVGPHVRDGEVLAGPGRRVAFLVTATGFAAGQGVIRGHARVGRDSVNVDQVNRPLEGDAQHDPPAGLVLYTAWSGDTVAASPAHPALRMRPLRAGAALVIAVDSAPMPPGAMLSLRAGPAASAWLGRRAPGDTVVWHTELATPDGTRVEQAVGGFPLLVQRGRGVVAEQAGVSAAFGPARHPRTAIGWRDDRLFWVVADGRQPPWSDGMSLDELAGLLLDLGATEAVNLDGGGSSAMVVQGRVVNRPSDAQGERAVGNALVLRGCR